MQVADNNYEEEQIQCKGYLQVCRPTGLYIGGTEVNGVRTTNIIHIEDRRDD